MRCLGWLNRIAPAAQVVDEALALARRITRNAPVAVRPLSLQARKRLQAAVAYRYGPRAFIEKRAPGWNGS